MKVTEMVTWIFKAMGALFLVGLILTIGCAACGVILKQKSEYNYNKAETFTERDFVWDDKIRPYKKIIIAGVNMVHRKNPACKHLTLSSVYISPIKGSKDDPVFFIPCGNDWAENPQMVNVFFSKSEVEKWEN